MDEIEEPDFSTVEMDAPLMVHGVLAPENAPSGDKRGFNEGALTARPLRLPFAWQKMTADGHDRAVVVASIDRVMRREGLIHWEGTLLDTPEADEFTALLAHFGRFGVSIDGDRGALDKERSESESMTWFEAARISGATAVMLPAFAEAYVAFGPHPDMPVESSEDGEVLVAGAALEFKRGAGWVTNPTETRRLHAYWTQKGQPGYAKVRWGTPGDFTRAKALIGEKIAKNSPEKMRFLNQIIAQWHHDALGYWPGELGKPGNAPDTPENRRRAAQHAGKVNASEEQEPRWEAVLTSAATGEKVVPPASYFTRHPETDALVVEEPDEFGIRRVHGYAAEKGVCHIGYANRCVEPPEDPYGGEYLDFHLGRTKTDQGYLHTGLLTYKVGHRDAKTILSETAEAAHFDDLNNAWAAVRIGDDDRGTWFSGVVLPKVDEDDLTLIEASGQVSGEWKYGALRALLTVNVPGYPVVRSSAVFDDDGNVIALAASAFGSVDNGTEGSPCAPEDDPIGEVAVAVMERIEARGRMDIIKQADAEHRFAALKQSEGR